MEEREEWCGVGGEGAGRGNGGVALTQEPLSFADALFAADALAILWQASQATQPCCWYVGSVAQRQCQHGRSS